MTRADEILARWMDDPDEDATDRLIDDMYRNRTALLTEQERRVLSAFSVGLERPMVAEVLGIGEETVKTHVACSVLKLRAKNMAHAVAMALRRGLID